MSLSMTCTAHAPQQLLPLFIALMAADCLLLQNDFIISNVASKELHQACIGREGGDMMKWRDKYMHKHPL